MRTAAPAADPVRRERRYCVDTNIFIDAIRTPGARDELRAFHAAYAPFEHLSAVVAHELRAGARGRSAAVLEKHVIEPFERRGRVFTPSYEAWKEAGRVLAQLTKGSGWVGASRAFVNDVILAMSCRESGVVLVTRNITDFARIARVRAFDFVPAWPIPA
jgi:predicted nucleic acid-binding protein